MGRLPLRSRPRAGAVWREAGLRTSRSTPDRPPSQPEGHWLRMTRVGGSSLVTAAGPCRTPTGFPILPASSGAPRKQFVPPATVPVPASRRPATPGVNASCGQVPGPAARRLPAVPELPFCASTPVSDRRGRAAPNPHGGCPRWRGRSLRDTTTRNTWGCPTPLQVGHPAVFEPADFERLRLRRHLHRVGDVA